MTNPYGILLGIVGGVLIIKIVSDGGFTTFNIICAFAYIAYYGLYIVLVNDDKKKDKK